ncbi:unnamed protein product [Nesidiocoris tenuis]|uniref:Uncharacterized protein n=1 Tax=Nesidiocoris tenuis TaxID=355587 RepID=A0A6H5H7K0_9HEMI|nr:unnamed protein product [Nesidiocoris tenuis]
MEGNENVRNAGPLSVECFAFRPHLCGPTAGLFGHPIILNARFCQTVDILNTLKLIIIHLKKPPFQKNDSSFPQIAS